MFLGSISPPEILSNPTNVRVNSQVTIQCKANSDSLEKLVSITLLDPSSVVLLRAARAFPDEPFRIPNQPPTQGISSNLDANNNMISVSFAFATLQNAGNYTCQLGFIDNSVTKAQYRLVVWGEYLFYLASNYSQFKYFLLTCTMLFFVARGAGLSAHSAVRSVGD